MRTVCRVLRLATIALLLVSCSSAPMHFYTLRQGSAENAPAVPVASAFVIDVRPVTVPAQVDQQELLVRESGQRVAILDNERWAAPLAAELREALAADLTDLLGTRDVHGLQQPPGTPLYRIDVEIRQFDSWPGRYAAIEADWNIRGTGEQPLATCTSHASESVGAGYEALVQGHQRSLTRVAGDIAAALRSISSAASVVCPKSETRG